MPLPYVPAADILTVAHFPELILVVDFYTMQHRRAQFAAGVYGAWSERASVITYRPMYTRGVWCYEHTQGQLWHPVALADDQGVLHGVVRVVVVVNNIQGVNHS